MPSISQAEIHAYMFICYRVYVPVPAWRSNLSHAGGKNITKHWHLQLLKVNKEGEAPAKWERMLLYLQPRQRTRPADED